VERYLIAMAAIRSLTELGRMATMRTMPFGSSTLFFLCSMGLFGSLLFGMPASFASDGGLVHIQTPSGVTIHAEIADTPLRRAVGLMYRNHLKKDHGM